MKYYINVGLTLVLSLILQNSIFNIITLWGVSINLPLCFFMMLTFILDNEKVVILWGLIIGALGDLTVGVGFGIRSLGFLIVALGILIFKEYFNNESRISVLVASSLGTLVYSCCTYFMSAFMYGHFSFIRFIKVTSVTILLNGIISLIIYLILRKFYNSRPRMSRYERYEIR